MGSGPSMRLVGRVRPLTPGIVSITKSAGVRALLAKQGDSAAARCNSIASLPHAKEAPRYESSLKDLTYTSAARVSIANVEALIDNRKHNTLKKGCGI